MEGSEVVAVGAPKDYAKLLEPINGGVRFAKRVTATTDIVPVFSARRNELQPLLKTSRQTLKPTAMVWVSWPKESSKVPTDVTELP